MWKKIDGTKHDLMLKKAIEFTSDYKLYGEFMLRVVKEWKYSCEENLSNVSINRRAWIGHAACCIALGCPEDITREAWHHLTKEQQDKANAKADLAIEVWIKQHRSAGDHRGEQLELLF